MVAVDAAVARDDVATLNDSAWYAAALDDAAQYAVTRHLAADDAARHAIAYDAITNDAVDADDGSAPANDALAHDAARHAIAYDDLARHERIRSANDDANWFHAGLKSRRRGQEVRIGIRHTRSQYKKENQEALA